MKNSRIVPCCYNCNYCEDASTVEYDEYLCRWYVDHLEPEPESVHINPDWICDYYMKEEPWPTN